MSMKELVEPLMAIQDEKISDLEDKITQLEASLTDQNLFVSTLENSVKILKDKSNHLEQYGRLDNLRILNVPKIQDENVHNIVMNLATQMKVELHSHSISVCHRTGQAKNVCHLFADDLAIMLAGSLEKKFSLDIIELEERAKIAMETLAKYAEEHMLPVNVEKTKLIFQDIPIQFINIRHILFYAYVLLHFVWLFSIWFFFTDKVDRSNVMPTVLPYKVVSIQSTTNGTTDGIMYKLCTTAGVISTRYSSDDLLNLTACNFSDLRLINPSNLPQLTFIQACKEYVRVLKLPYGKSKF
ncbi:unnamed protein product [Didymodactylos carnosus]|uniref:Reverse transcriptase domain-containing protein n=1 Tax=Didymodactylos carnosus TaxID=1234261 RepID=A0A814LY96_9BILA|nr:unnamed protein product [Didymodactylos carnosus]CAF3838483.1 unnamed protein product [Didymodactylos carnosus]